MKSVMIIEPQAEGHRMQHVRRIAREVIGRGLGLRILTRANCLEHPGYLAIHDELGEGFETCLLTGPWLAERWVRSRSLTLRQVGYFWMFRRFFRALPPSDRPDIVFCGVIDQCDKVMSIIGSPFGSIPWAGITFLMKFHYGTMGAMRPEGRLDRLKRGLFARLLNIKTLVALFTIDELLNEYIKEHWRQHSSKVYYVGDPVALAGDSTREEARARLALPEGAVALLVYGALESRKNIDVLLEAAEDPRFPSQVYIVLAGRQDPVVREILASPAARRLRALGRLIEHDRYLGDGEEWESFCAADLVWLGYRSFYVMSGVMVQAASMGLPIIASEQGLIGWMARKYGLGPVVDPANPAAVAVAVAEVARDSSAAARYGANGKRMAQAHSSRAFAEAICDRLEIEAGCDPAEIEKGRR